MDESTIKLEEVSVGAGLDVLSGYRAELETLQLAKADAIQAVLTDEQREKMLEIENEYREKETDLKVKIDTLESSIKTSVLNFGKTISGTFLQAVHYAGRVTWNAKSLDSYVKDNPKLVELFPGIMDSRNQGADYVSIRRAKKVS